MVVSEMRTALESAQKVLLDVSMGILDSGTAKNNQTAMLAVQKALDSLHKAGIYRVKYQGAYYAADFPCEDLDEWYLSGEDECVIRAELDEVVFLGPLEPEEPASDTND